MYICNICEKEVAVDHVNPPKFTCECVGGKAVTKIEGHAYGVGSVNARTASLLNNNLGEVSAMILRNTLFAISANEFMQNKKKEIHATDIVVKDSATGRSFTFTLTGKEM